jgi:hypothetical protein
MRWVVYVEHMETEKVFTRFWVGGLQGRDHWKDLGIVERITLRWTLER